MQTNRSIVFVLAQCIQLHLPINHIQMTLNIDWSGNLEPSPVDPIG